MVIASTLLTKRHAVVDIAAGVIFGWIVYRLIFGSIHQEAADSEALVEDLEIRDRPIEKPAEQIETLAQFDGSRRLQEFAIPVTLAATGLSISGWAITHSSVTTLAVGIITTTVALNSFLRLMHEGIHDRLLPGESWNRIMSVLLGSTVLTSFSACRVLHLRYLRTSGTPGHPYDHSHDLRSRSFLWFQHFAGLIGGLLLHLILVPVSALRFCSASQRKLICSEYALLFLMCSVLLRSFSASALLLVWVLPVVLTRVFDAIRGSSQFELKTLHGSQLSRGPLAWLDIVPMRSCDR